MGSAADECGGSGLKVICACVSEESNATEFVGRLVGDVNKSGTEKGNMIPSPKIPMIPLSVGTRLWTSWNF